MLNTVSSLEILFNTVYVAEHEYMKDYLFTKYVYWTEMLHLFENNQSI